MTMPFYSRKSPRIPDYDYSTENYYFITICTQGKKCFLGSIDALHPAGLIAQRHILELSNHYSHVSVDKFIIMPNHIHMILVLDKGNHADVKQIIGQYKSGVTREVRKLYPDIVLWQRSFHDHIIRNQKRYEMIWMYIETNPIRWEKDCFYSEI